jgi:hypothetical protein
MRKPLDADGGHPAERYAGTHNGLCYPCTATGPYMVEVAELDGCRRLSYPPSCPSLRRDRETELAYPDCEQCLGAWHTWAQSGRGVADRQRRRFCEWRDTVRFQRGLTVKLCAEGRHYRPGAR